MKGINQLVRKICIDLNIRRPKVIEVEELNGTMLAYYDKQNDTLVIKKCSIEYDGYFSIMHELRHKYQLEYGFFNEESYILRDEVDTIEQYNAQKEEIDANAYAYYMMAKLYYVNPLFNGVDKKIVSMIEKRMQEIAKEKEKSN